MKATLIYATGRIEEVNVPDDKVIERVEKVTHMHDPRNHQVDVFRRFERHHVENANTLKDGKAPEDAWGPLNDGFVVYLEARPVLEVGADDPIVETVETKEIDPDKTGELAIPAERSTNPYASPAFSARR